MPSGLNWPDTKHSFLFLSLSPSLSHQLKAFLGNLSVLVPDSDPVSNLKSSQLCLSSQQAVRIAFCFPVVLPPNSNKIVLEVPA